MIRKESDVVDIAYKYLKKVFNLDDADDALWNEIKQIPYETVFEEEIVNSTTWYPDR
jgi:hypothetical protein